MTRLRRFGVRRVLLVGGLCVAVAVVVGALLWSLSDAPASIAADDRPRIQEIGSMQPELTNRSAADAVSRRSSPRPSRTDLGQLRELAGLKGMSARDAFDEFERLQRDPSADRSARTAFLARWIIANPGQLPVLLKWLKSRPTTSRRELAFRSEVFEALGRARTEASRDALLSVLGDDSWTTADRIEAARVSIGDPALSERFVDRLIAMSRVPDDPGSNVGSDSTALLGAVVAAQRSERPDLANMARRELGERLSNAADSQRLKQAIVGASNADDAALNARSVVAASKVLVGDGGPMSKQDRRLDDELVRILGKAIGTSHDAVAKNALRARLRVEMKKGARGDAELMRLIGQQMSVNELLRP